MNQCSHVITLKISLYLQIFFTQSKGLFSHFLTLGLKRNWVFATNINFQIHKSQKPNRVNLWYFKLTLPDLTVFVVWNIKGLRKRVVKIKGSEIRVCGKNSIPLSRQSFDAPYHNFGHSLKSDHSPILVELKSIKSYVHRSVYILLKIVANVAYLPQKQPYIANSENLRAGLGL